MPFADKFIEGYSAGQQAKQQKLDTQKSERLEQFAQEDRDIEKQLLQHRLRELKIGEKIKAREAARENYGFLEGRPESELFTPSETGTAEPGSVTQMNAAGVPSTGMRKSVTIPGIEELGIGAQTGQPLSMEEQLQALFAQKTIEAQTKPWEANVPEGGTFVRGVGNDITSTIKGDPKLVAYTTRDASGKQKTEYITEEERTRRGPAIMERLPSRASTAMTTSGEDIGEIIEGIRRGDRPADTSGYRGVDRTRIDAGLLKSGFSITKAINDQKALQQHYANLNSDQFSALRAAADATETAITELEKANDDWQAGGFGTFNSARLALAKSGKLGAEAQQTATGMENLVQEVQNGLATIKSGGSAPINAALERASTQLATDFSQGRMAASLNRIRNEVQHRISAIRNLQPILPSQAKVDKEGDVKPIEGYPGTEQTYKNGKWIRTK